METDFNTLIVFVAEKIMNMSYLDVINGYIDKQPHEILTSILKANHLTIKEVMRRYTINKISNKIKVLFADVKENKKEITDAKCKLNKTTGGMAATELRSGIRLLKEEKELLKEEITELKKQRSAIKQIKDD